MIGVRTAKRGKWLIGTLGHAIEALQQKAHREWLRRQDPHCHWCGRLTVPGSAGVDWARNGKQRALTATLDHLITRRAGRTTPDLANTVLACNQCNKARNDAESRGEHVTITPNGEKPPIYAFTRLRDKAVIRIDLTSGPHLSIVRAS